MHIKTDAFEVWGDNINAEQAAAMAEEFKQSIIIEEAARRTINDMVSDLMRVFKEWMIDNDVNMEIEAEGKKKLYNIVRVLKSYEFKEWMVANWNKVSEEEDYYEIMRLYLDGLHN